MNVKKREGGREGKERNILIRASYSRKEKQKTCNKSLVQKQIFKIHRMLPFTAVDAGPCPEHIDTGIYS